MPHSKIRQDAFKGHESILLTAKRLDPEVLEDHFAHLLPTALEGIFAHTA